MKVNRVKAIAANGFEGFITKPNKAFALNVSHYGRAICSRLIEITQYHQTNNAAK